MSNQISDPVLTAVPGYLAGTWKADSDHSELAFAVRQMGKKVPGRFRTFDITIVTGADPLDSSVSATIDLASVDTANAKRDEHIRSETFLDVGKHPTAQYDSTGIRRVGDGWVVEGDLTLHGITKSVSLALAMTGFSAGPNGSRHAAFSAAACVNRSEFGIDRWTGGGLMVGDKVPIGLEIRAIRQ